MDATHILSRGVEWGCEQLVRSSTTCHEQKVGSTRGQVDQVAGAVRSAGNMTSAMVQPSEELSVQGGDVAGMNNPHDSIL